MIFSFICDTQPLSKIIKNQKLFRVGMFYVELNPGEDADEEDVISQSIKEIHQVVTLDQNPIMIKKTCFRSALKISQSTQNPSNHHHSWEPSNQKINRQSAQKLSDNIERLSNDQVMKENIYRSFLNLSLILKSYITLKPGEVREQREQLELQQLRGNERFCRNGHRGGRSCSSSQL